jgi:hypothetical protein
MRDFPAEKVDMIESEWADARQLAADAEQAVGLHSLPQAERFYTDRCRMTRLGHDSEYFGLTYFELTPAGAADLLAALGESS